MTDPLLPLDEIEAAVRAMSVAPWRPNGVMVCNDSLGMVFAHTGGYGEENNTDNDVRGVCVLRNHALAMVAEIRRLRREVSRQLELKDQACRHAESLCDEVGELRAKIQKQDELAAQVAKEVEELRKPSVEWRDSHPPITYVGAYKKSDPVEDFCAGAEGIGPRGTVALGSAAAKVIAKEIRRLRARTVSARPLVEALINEFDSGPSIAMPGSIIDLARKWLEDET